MPQTMDPLPSLTAWLAARAGDDPNAVALSAPGRPALQYPSLKDEVARLALRLGEIGVTASDRIAIVLPDGPEMITAFLAVGSVAGAAPLNPAYGAPQLDFYLADLEARWLITAPGVSDAAEAVAGSRGVGIVHLHWNADGPAGSVTAEPVRHPACQASAAAEAGDRPALILHTSGTTSRPKMVPLSQTNLLASASNIRRWLHLGREDRLLCFMPLFHIHGIVASLAALDGGGAVACPGRFVATRFFDWLEALRPTWYSAVPTMHQGILQRASNHAPVIAANPLRFIRSASAALPDRVARGLESAFGAPVVEAYGMTETANQMASNPLPPGERKLGSVGLPTGVDIAVMAPDGTMLDAGDVGEVVVRGPSVTAGYLANVEANADAFVNGWFRTGDQGRLDEDGYLWLTGRLKELIIRGGENIAPREIDDALLACPGVAQAAAFALPDEQLGEDVAAAVVPETGQTLSEQQLRRLVAGRLEPHKIPRRIVVVDEIPKGPTGKLQRSGLAARFGLVTAETDAPDDPEERFTAPRSEAERALAAIWSEVLRIERISVDAPFLSLGGDSVLAAQVLARVRERLAVDLPILVFFEAPTIAEMAPRLEAAQAELAAILDQIEREDRAGA